MKVLFFLAFTVIGCTQILAQGVHFDWGVSFGNGLDDAVAQIVKDHSGNLYTAGTFSGHVDFDPGPVTNSQFVGGSAKDGYIQKLDNNGNYLWAKVFGAHGSTGSSQHANCKSVVIDDSNYVYIAGNFRSAVDFDPGPGNFTITPPGSNTFVVKLDSMGNFVWAKSIDGPSNRVYELLYDNGALYVGGEFSDSADFDPGAGSQYISANNNDVFIQKLDLDGNLIWVVTNEGDANGGGRLLGLTADSAANVYVAGYYSGMVDFDPSGSTFNMTALNIRDGFIQKIDSSGNFVWAKSIGGVNGVVDPTDIQTDNNGLFITGTFNDTVDFDPGAAIVNLGSRLNAISGFTLDAFILKLDLSGNFIRVNQLGGPETDYIYSIALDSVSDMYLTGSYRDTVDFNLGTGIANLESSPIVRKLFLLKLDSSSQFKWVKGLDGTSHQYGTSICVDQANEDIYLGGGFYDTTDFDFGVDTFNLVSNWDRNNFLLKLNQCDPIYSTDVQLACDSMVWIDGNTYYSDNNTAIYIMQYAASNGCDSVVQLDLTILQKSFGIDSIQTCDSLVWTDGNTYYSDNNTAVDTFVNVLGCDSIVTLDLTILQPTSAFDNLEACDSLVWMDGITYYADNNSATWTLTNTEGCDSIITLNLNITEINTQVSQSGWELSAVNQGGASYQWLDCDNNYAPVPGADSREFEATENGNYAVEITIDNCSAVSDCYSVTGIGIKPYTSSKGIYVYPNPTTNLVNIEFDTQRLVDIKVYDVTGKTVLHQKGLNTLVYQFSLTGSSGLYLVEINDGSKVNYFKLHKLGTH